MNRSTCTVTTKHPTGYKDGDHKVQVTINQDGTRYCTADGFGCSRDYKADSDSSAIRQFFSEHACEVVQIRLSNGRILKRGV